jgi:hypothetical protein
MRLNSTPSGEDGSESMELYLLSDTHLHIEILKHRFNLTSAKCAAVEVVSNARLILACVY